MLPPAAAAAAAAASTALRLPCSLAGLPAALQSGPAAHGLGLGAVLAVLCGCVDGQGRARSPLASTYPPMTPPRAHPHADAALALPLAPLQTQLSTLSPTDVLMWVGWAVWGPVVLYLLRYRWAGGGGGAGAGAGPGGRGGGAAVESQLKLPHAPNAPTPPPPVPAAPALLQVCLVPAAPHRRGGRAAPHPLRGDGGHPHVAHGGGLDGPPALHAVPGLLPPLLEGGGGWRAGGRQWMCASVVWRWGGGGVGVGRGRRCPAGWANARNPSQPPRACAVPPARQPGCPLASLPAASSSLVMSSTRAPPPSSCHAPPPHTHTHTPPPHTHAPPAPGCR